MSSVADEAERYLRALAEPETDPRPRECLVCYVARGLRSHGCDHTRLWTLHFRDLRSPRATALEHRLLAQGVFCDCGLLGRDGYRPSSTPLVRDLLGRRSDDPDVLPACDGVRRTSTRPCALWERRSQGAPQPPPAQPDVEPPF